MRTLVASPHAEHKDYSFSRWAEATASYDRLLSFHVADSIYARKVQGKGIRTALYMCDPHPRRPGRKAIYGPMYNAAWRAIVDNAEGYTHILSLDTDVIPGGDILSAMEAEYDGGFLRHGVPWRAVYRRPGQYGYETSCTLASIEDWTAALDKAGSLGELCTLYEVVGNPHYFHHKDVLLMNLEHLDDGVDAR